MLTFRDLTENDIEVRVQSAKANGVVLLLYKNARVDMSVLDETVGAENWQNKFYECKGNLFCSLGINVKYDKPNELPLWVWKDDCGVPSNTEAEKGEASDARKRAGFAFGLGRELYSSPFIWVKKEDCGIVETEKNGRKSYACYDNFVVEKIKIENKKIVGLAIKNLTSGKRCFVWQA